MHTRRKRLVLMLCSLLTTSAAALVMAWGWFEISMPELDGALLPPAATAVADDAELRKIDLDHACWRVRLSVPEAASVESTSPSSDDEEVMAYENTRFPIFHLLGVVVEGRTSHAIIADEQLQIDVRAHNETLELEPSGAMIKRIDPDSVVIAFDGMERTLGLDD